MEEQKTRIVSDVLIQVLMNLAVGLPFLLAVPIAIKAESLILGCGFIVLGVYSITMRDQTIKEQTSRLNTAR